MGLFRELSGEESAVRELDGWCLFEKQRSDDSGFNDRGN